MLNSNHKELQIVTNQLSVRQYQSLRATTNWKDLSNNQVEKALANNLFSVTVFKNEELLGMGRVIGDGAIYFYIQDVIVHPKFKKMNVGKLIMSSIHNFLDTATHNYAFIGLMAAKDVSKFYEKMGYELRDNRSPGMYKIIER